MGESALEMAGVISELYTRSSNTFNTVSGSLRPGFSKPHTPVYVPIVNQLNRHPSQALHRTWLIAPVL
jgi:hypothetical protein